MGNASMKLNFSMIAGFGAIVVAGFLWLLKDLRNTVEPQYLQATEESLVDTAHILAAFLEQEIVEGVPLESTRFRGAMQLAASRRFEAQVYSLKKTSVGMGVYVSDARGTIVFDSEGSREGADYSKWNDVLKTLRGEYGARSTRTDEEDPLSSILYVAAPILKDGAIVGVVTVSKPQRAMRQFIDETRQGILWIGGMACLGIVIGAALFSYWMIRPVRRLTAYVRAVRDGGRVPVPPLGHGEFRTLGRAFEEMRDALEGRKYVENYVQNLTHEIKSPLAAIRGAVELLQESNVPPEKEQRFLSNIHDETLRSQNIVDRLLYLVALESQKTLQVTTEVDLGQVLQRVCDGAYPLLEQKNIALLREIPGEGDSPVLVQGDVFALRMAINNVISNAIDFSPENSEILVSLVEKGDFAEVSVADRGPGLPEYAREKVFERFYSLKGQVTGRKGSGLGLCFVREAAELHGGSAEIRDREGGGAELIVRIKKEP